MSVNSLNNNGVSTDAYSAYRSSTVTAKENRTKENDTQKTDKKDTNVKPDNGVVYEPSDKTPKTYKPDKALIAKLQADTEARTTQLRDLVEQMISKQGSTYGQTNDMWKFLAGGNFTVDAATKSQAQADIAEDGYWGVNKTSDRIIDFAKALTGGDPQKIEEMKNAFIKGFKQATAAWGQKLPDISQKTYDAVIGKFDSWANDSSPVQE